MIKYDRFLNTISVALRGLKFSFFIYNVFLVVYCSNNLEDSLCVSHSYSLPDGTFSSYQSDSIVTTPFI